jgi:hypothetical protein
MVIFPSLWEADSTTNGTLDRNRRAAEKRSRRWSRSRRQRIARVAAVRAVVQPTVCIRRAARSKSVEM